MDENSQIKSRYSLSSAGAAGSLFLKEICNKPNSRVSGTTLFGLDISFLQQICEIITSQPQQSITPVNNHKRCFAELTSQSQKNKRISMAGKEIATQTLTILKKNKFTSSSEEIIASLETIVLKINGEIVELNFNSDNNTADFTRHLDSIIRSCDETLISRDSYRRLAKAVPNLIREHVVERRRNEITIETNTLVPIKLFNIHSVNFDDGNDDENQQDVSGIEFNDDDVDIIIPILTASMPPVLKVGDKISIRLSGDGRNVGRKQKHVMLTMCVLNEEEAVLSPAHQYSICLYLGKESYDSLSTVSAKFSHELEQLKTNGYKDSNNTIWPVELFFSGDWKFVALVLGINAATSNYFCLYCNCHKDERYNMDKVWLNSKNTRGRKNTMLFQEIDQNNWIIDELHLMLRISDVLFQCLFYELIKKKDFANDTQTLIIAEMKRLHIHFEFYPPATKNGKWEWTSLMGPDKEKILKDFQIKQLFDGRQATRGQDIEHLWREFYRLYKIMRQKSITDEEIDQFEADAKQWIRDFCRPTIGNLNDANQQEGMYLRTDITPYMHVFAQHVPQFMRYLKQKGMVLRHFSTSSIEKKNHQQVRLFFGGTTMGGGKSKNPVIHDILCYEN
ncbi:hypothetical protein C1645_742608 [Glomus cerebriforme]|uniref:Uncharacterized protein n=1 Tax=Glomus cerebriforme TaxID=658196 RepID=A0A397SGN3_9GLOM|nr:hypothetical protein C1645_742608 [Glomus cerebriforme]